MGAVAFVVDGPRVVEVPERFRLSDENPLTSRPYARSTFGDLPPYVGGVVTDVIGLGRAEWDALVDADAVYSVVGPFRKFSLSGFLRSVRDRGSRPGPSSMCPDCWGTLATWDTDGSVTGRVGSVFLCSCAGL